MKRNNIFITEIPEWDENGKRIENIFKAMMAENFLNLGKEMGIQIYEV